MALGVARPRDGGRTRSDGTLSTLRATSSDVLTIPFSGNRGRARPDLRASLPPAHSETGNRHLALEWTPALGSERVGSALCEGQIDARRRVCSQPERGAEDEDDRCQVRARYIEERPCRLHALVYGESCAPGLRQLKLGRYSLRNRQSQTDGTWCDKNRDPILSIENRRGVKVKPTSRICPGAYVHNITDGTERYEPGEVARAGEGRD